LRTATNSIIINLAFTDIGVAGIGYPMSAASDIHGSWKFGYTGCQIYAALNIFFKMTVRSYNLLIAAGVAERCVLVVNAGGGLGWIRPRPHRATCTINWRHNDRVIIAVNFVLPLTRASNYGRHQRKNIVMILMFLVAWSPYSLVCLWASFGDPGSIPASMAIIAPLFAKSSTFYNPCIYVVANRKFRRAIIGMIRCQTRQRITINTQVPMTMSNNLTQ
uniref:Retinal pigment epithelium-derived rhodopsin homolog n=1 Tax=Sphaeramia orbicularis TaxID=375764 RepID=A0A673B8Y8_9TELE